MIGRDVAGPAQLVDLPLDRPGRHWGSLRIPWSHHDSAYGQIVIPVAIVHGHEAGPTALLTAGVHGDEHEGQIALAELARNLEPGQVRGRVIIVPVANPPAARAGRRTSPLDGGNLARAFPGDPSGSVTAQIADGLSRLLLEEADLLLDFHGGGSSLEYLPCAWGRLPEERELAGRVLDGLLAFGAPLTGIVAPSGHRGTLVAEALARGKVALATEIGGGGTVTRASMALARTGIRRVLHHFGLSSGSEPAVEPSRLVVIRPDHFLRSPGAGLFEPSSQLGDEVRAGKPAGYLHDPERPRRAPEPILWPSDGLVICRRVPTAAETGDVLAHLASDVSREALLAGCAA